MIQATEYNIEIVSECSNVPEAVAAINEFHPQVVFLDVQMPTYAGYEIVNFFKTISFDIIFVTAFDQYALKAFELCAVDYLVKPIDRILLKKSLGKLFSKFNTMNKLDHYQTLLDSVKDNTVRKLVIPELGNRRVINLASIVAIEADGAYTCIYLKEGKGLTTSKNLKYYESVLSSEKRFFRSHRSWLVNIERVERFNRTKSLLFMNGNIQAKISRSKYEGFESAMGNKN